MREEFNAKSLRQREEHSKEIAAQKANAAKLAAKMEDAQRHRIGDLKDHQKRSEKVFEANSNRAFASISHIAAPPVPTCQLPHCLPA